MTVTTPHGQGQSHGAQGCGPFPSDHRIVRCGDFSLSYVNCSELRSSQRGLRPLILDASLLIVSQLRGLRRVQPRGV